MALDEHSWTINEVASARYMELIQEKVPIGTELILRESATDIGVTEQWVGSSVVVASEWEWQDHYDQAACFVKAFSKNGETLDHEWAAPRFWLRADDVRWPEPEEYRDHPEWLERWLADRELGIESEDEVVEDEESEPTCDDCGVHAEEAVDWCGGCGSCGEHCQNSKLCTDWREWVGGGSEEDEDEEAETSVTPRPYALEVLSPEIDNGTMPESRRELEDAVVGRRIVSAKIVDVGDDSSGTEKLGCAGKKQLVLTLDDFTRVRVVDKRDCCAFTEVKNGKLAIELMDHIITGVGTTDGYETWHIYADAGDVMELTVGWSSGNPFYYAYGFYVQIEKIG